MARTINGKCTGRAARIEAEDERDWQDAGKKLRRATLGALGLRLSKLMGEDWVAYDKFIDSCPDGYEELVAAMNKEIVRLEAYLALYAEELDYRDHVLTNAINTPR